ncbi:MAG: hypothetical protein WKF83_09080 [Nocardioidaceae bacterium]
MSEVDPARGKHRLARHRGPSVLEQTRDRVCDAILAVPTPSIPAGAGRVVAVTAVGGLLSAAAVVGTQAAGSNTAQVARAGAETVGGPLLATPLVTAPVTPVTVPPRRRRAMPAVRR